MHSDAGTGAGHRENGQNADLQKGVIERPATMALPIALIVIFAITAWRIACLRFDTTDLFVDEAQYWLWSTRLDFGYYSKPPMIAWVIHGVTHLFGSDDIFWIRISGPVFHMLTALVLTGTARYFGGRSLQAWTGVTFITLPGVAFSSIFFSTDVVLLFFLAIALWAYIGLTRQPSALLSIVFGLAFAAAFLSKYAILFMVPGGLIALLFLPGARIAWRDFFLATGVAVLGAVPNLWWNYANQLTTVRHTENIAGWRSLSLHPLGALEFFAAQFGVVGPIVFFAILWALLRLFQGRGTSTEKLLLCLSVPVVFLITLQALMAKAYANWAVTAYVAGTLLAVLILQGLWPRGLRVSLIINGVVSLLLPLSVIFAHELRLPNGDEVMKRYLGRSDVSREAADIAAQARLGIIVSSDRDLLADMFYTLRTYPLRIYAKPEAGLPDNYYEQTLTLPADTNEPVLMLTGKPMTCVAAPPLLLKSWQPSNGVYRGRTFYAYRAAPQCLVP